MPPRSAKMKRRIFGFQRRVWWPKWTPASSSSRMETAPVEAGSVETDMESSFRIGLWCVAPAGVEAHLPRGEAHAPRLGRRGVGTGRGKVSWASRRRVRASAAARSGGSGDETSTGSPGERMREREPRRVEELPLEAEVARDAVVGSPATGRSIAARWTRIWCVRPVSSRTREQRVARQQLLELEVRHRRRAACRCRASGGARSCRSRPIGASIVPAPRARPPDDEREVLARQLPAPHELLEPPVRLGRARDDEQPGRVAVEPVDDARPVRSVPARRRRGREQPCTSVPPCVTRRPGARRGRPACRRRAGARPRTATSSSIACGVERLVGAGAGGSNSISSPPASLWLFGRARPSTSTAPAASSRSAARARADLRQPGEEAVEPLARGLVRDGEPRQRSATRRGSRSARTSAARRIATPITMKLSARLNAGQ